MTDSRVQVLRSDMKTDSEETGELKFPNSNRNLTKGNGFSVGLCWALEPTQFFLKVKGETQNRGSTKHSTKAYFLTSTYSWSEYLHYHRQLPWDNFFLWLLYTYDTCGRLYKCYVSPF